MDVRDRIVWITGASSGIGAALARKLASSGARCVLSARSQDRLTALQAGLTNPDRHLVLPLDVSEFGTHQEAADRIGREMGPVDLLINNAGISQRGRSWDTDLDTVRHILDVNFVGAVSLTQAVLPGMLERGDGHIAVVSSLTGRISTPGRTAYAASKHAVHGYFEGLRAELHGTGVGVTLAAPGYVRTEISFNAMAPGGERHGKMDRQQAQGMEPKEAAERITRAITKRKAEVLFGGPERFGVLLFRLFPGIYRRLVHRFEPG